MQASKDHRPVWDISNIAVEGLRVNYGKNALLCHADIQLSLQLERFGEHAKRRATASIVICAANTACEGPMYSSQLLGKLAYAFHTLGREC